ncbi:MULTISPECIES: TIGR03016 family PEP-CTERM system-associated outer membrane protein [unclassified Agarivorans]|uniref:TIGR03016 family PEP-CTERM system-associated outer membrane protein n=1 Tax=unclassified Agarivorans TaxID=2636026 RepID=UPI0026E2F11B|nr:MULTISPECIES: TIGR03016 family PEP-CTERM system-associated outer membrane protein [unclassified Agarivorans]MDO6687726.1 TIGR03016 family PEP-CTERM system-associated outer membrane protein [Agarivorans sp. 3_MG-2023]MDO6717273.1 TIGR03016 family PEP-CTERM system-associated outer membrane protein [Agarivorans sp. 2_MG-2023]
MATDTAMDMRKNAAPSVVLALAIALGLSTSAYAAEVQFRPEIGAELVYTDNAGLSEESPEAGEIGILSAGIVSEVIGKDGEISLDYQARQTYHSYDSNKNQLYHELDFAADKKLGKSGFSVDAIASIDILPAEVSSNAITDIISGDLIQGSELGLGLSYQSNRRKWIDLSARAGASLYRYEDDRGNNNDFDGSLLFKNGQKVNTVFWLVDSSYIKREARGNSKETENVKYKGEFGLQQRSGFSPFIRYYAESYLEGVSSSEKVGESESWGPAIRYFRSRLSYLELSYNFSLDKDKNDDYVGTALNLEPNRRTKLFFEYSKRFYGNAYEFTFNHKKRRVTTDISYIEEPTSFDRRFFVEGDSVEEQKLDKTFRWNTDLNLRRSGIDVELRHQTREGLRSDSDFIKDITYGGGIGLDHKLSRNLTIAFGFDYDHYTFDRLNGTDQIDKYSRYDLSLNQDLIEGFFLTYRYQYTHRSSNTAGRNYDENRVSINATKQF